MRTDYSGVSFRNDGKLKLLIIVGTRPEIIRLAAVITKCREYFDCLLAHTGQNYDYNLNGIFFRDLKLADPDVYMDAVGDDLGATVGNIINCSYKLMAAVKPDALLVLGDTNSCLSAIGAKRLHIPIFHMEAGNRCKDECLPEETNRRIVDIISDVNLCYSEHARRNLAENGLPKERTYVTGSPMAEVLHANLEEIEASDILERPGGEHRHGEELPFAVQRHQRDSGEIRVANPLLLSSAFEEAAGGERFPAERKSHPPRAVGIPRLQLPADERSGSNLGFGDAARGKLILHLHRETLPCGVHPHEHGTTGGLGQGVLHPGGDRREEPVAGGGHGNRDGGERG